MHVQNRHRITLAAALMALLLLLSPLAPGCSKPVPRGSAPRPRAATAPATPSPQRYSFIVCGDPQNNYEVFDRVLEAAKSVDFLIVAGDLTGSGTATEFRNFVDRMRSSGVKYFAVPGNHDVATSPVGENYATHIGPPHQSFDYRNSHFLLVDNSTPSLGFYPAQQEWAARDLASAKARGFEHTFAVAHVPPGWPYSARATREQIPGIDNNRELEPVLEAGGVEELFCGHVHTYDREEADGLLITITGGAGAPLFGTDSFHHYVRVEIDGRRRTQRVVRI